MATAASRLSSVWARAALAAAGLAVVAVVVGVVLTREGDDETEERRKAVAEYIADVNTVQQASILALERVGETYRELRLRPEDDAEQLARVREAERTLRETRARLAAVTAPADARGLRRRLLQLLDRQVALAAEVRGMVEYLPLQAREAGDFAAASRRLNSGLAAATTAPAQQAALAAYVRAIDAIAARLERADVPEVLEPSRVEEVRRLRRLVRDARLVSEALAGQDAAEVDRRFREFLRTNADVGTSRAERAAVVAYNRRVGLVADARERVAQERERIDLALR